MFFEKKKTDKVLTGLTEEKTEKTQITKTKNERESIAIEFREIKRIIREGYEQFYVNILNNLHEMEKFLDCEN